MSDNFKKRLLTSIVLFSLLFLMFLNNYILGYFLIIFGIFSILEFDKIVSIIFKKKRIKQFLFNLLFIFYISIFCLIFFIFSFTFYVKILIFIILITCVASDLGGYIFGKVFKGPKLTKISPNKTIFGSIGSFVFSIIFASILIYYFTNSFNLKIILIGLITSLACQCGDLIISFLKRKSKLNDTGNFLPGHGGILDRIDGILLGIPIGFLILSLVY
jgi:phosphatidate cytidylyltransferase